MSVAAWQEVKTVEDLKAVEHSLNEIRSACDSVQRAIDHSIDSLAKCVTGGRMKLREAEESPLNSLKHLSQTRTDSIEAMRKAIQTLVHAEPVFEPKGFALRLLNTYDKHAEEVDAVLSQNLTGWTLGRLYAEDKALMRLATTELLHFHDVPPPVIIDEYTDLSRSYGDKDSPKLVTGVLDSIAKKHPRAKPAKEPVEES